MHALSRHLLLVMRCMDNFSFDWCDLYATSHVTNTEGTTTATAIDPALYLRVSDPGYVHYYDEISDRVYVRNVGDLGWSDSTNAQIVKSDEAPQDFDTTEIDKYIESLKKEVVTTED